MHLNTVRVLLATAVALCAIAVFADEGETERRPAIAWQTDYPATMEAAEREKTPMAVYFCDETNPACGRFERELENASAARKYLEGCARVRLPLDARIASGGRTLRLLDHDAFADLQGGAGLVIFDFATETESEKGSILRTVPFRVKKEVDFEDICISPAEPPPSATPAEPIAWLSDYREATAEAERRSQMLLIYFARNDGSGGCSEFESAALRDSHVRERLQSYVCLKVPDDVRVNMDDREIVLLKHSSFAEMVGLPGVAVVDFRDPQTPYYGQVVSTFPFLRAKAYDTKQLSVILTLPPGKLTQRTLIYAVRTHPDAPQSTSGQLDEYLMSEAESHSVRQAQMRLQGHHLWESRFQRINLRLPRGMLATEVCAESWPGQCLLEAAIDCVQCWRQSSGHWRSVRAAQPVFGYDIRRGSNGIWYATGIFGRRGG